MATVRKVRAGRRDTKEALRKRLINAILPVLEEGVRMREEYTAKWSAQNRPHFYPHLSFPGDKIIAEVRFEANVAEGSTEGKSVYELLRDGTDVRRANLSSDWSSKTTANSLVTKEGSGGVIGVGMHLEFPGIAARNTDALVNKEIEPKMKRAIERAVKG